MIYKLSRKSADDELLLEFSNEERTLAKSSLPYDKVIVKKPWGYEYLVFENEFVAVWMLHIARKRKTSFHAHVNKKTSLLLFSSSATFRHLNGEIKLKPFDSVIIDKGAFHSTEAFSDLAIEPQSENGIWVMEIESPPAKTDLVRVSDEYGRKHTSYEGTENMVYEPKMCLRLTEPKNNSISKEEFFNCTFAIMQADFLKKKMENLDKNSLVCVIGKKTQAKSANSYLKIGELYQLKEFLRQTKKINLAPYTIMLIERKSTSVKLSDYVFSFIASLGVKEVFAVCGGGAMHLVDSLGKNENLKYIAVHHEQAAAMAAESYSRITSKPGAALVTSGPGGTNTITGVCGAWIDSIPTIFISGQVTTDTLIGETSLRQFGIQEADIIKLVKPITKYAVTVTDASTIKYHLQKAAHLATSGRPGPVWLDIPLDIQSKLINPDKLRGFKPPQKEKIKKYLLEKKVSQCLKMLIQAKRPVLISGYGIRLAGAQANYRKLVNILKIPVISSWTTSDLIPTNHELYVGRSGIMGDRAGNFTVQNSDLLLIIGSRMSIPHVGYNYNIFAREAKKIMVDIDEVELKKSSISLDLPIKSDAGEFIEELLRQIEKNKFKTNVNLWLTKCRAWKAKYPVVLPEYKKIKKGVNSFYFIGVLSQKLGKDAVVVTDMGTSFTCTMQTFKVKDGQRLFTSSGHSSMGFGLPGAIGACFANNRKKTICVAGDGGLQMNIQELQTLVHYKLPIILFVLNNGGYLTIKLMQQNHFGRYVGSEPSSGLSFPDMLKVAQAYGIPSVRITNNKELLAKIDKILAHPGPFICEIMMPENQPLIPRVSSLKKPDGSIVSKPLEDLYPFLSRKEFFENMIVKPVEVLRE
ncbi:MAG: thiamine pyrophosphate-binding protein [Candidatus Omnitrophica bacterium]|nr:thiamine pyrophosphate-binding protein [Candidatus Omnitrophota bacterium]